MSDSNIETHKDSPPASPIILSSPARNEHPSDDQHSCTNSSEVELVNSSDSSVSAKASPPSSPVRYGQKRPSYSAYKENASLPIPRQTLNRWKKMCLGGAHSVSSDDNKVDENNTDDNNTDDNDSDYNYYDASALPQDLEREVLGNEPQTYEAEVPDEISHQSHSPAKSRSSLATSDSEKDGSESGDSINQSDSNLSGGSLSNHSNSDFNADDDCGSEVSDLDYDDVDDPFEDNSLYPGCEKTKDEAIYELINVYLCNNLSKSALGDFLKIYVSSLPAGHVMPSTVHQLLAYVKGFFLPMSEIEHFYCQPSMHAVVSRTDPCADCGSVDIGVFYELPLENSIKFLFEQRGLAELIDKYSEQLRTEANDSICDIIDGSEYVRVWTDVSNKYKLTLILNTDGVSPHTSSKAKFWPLLFTIMEVPAHLRSSFTIVWGIWFDKKLKPDMNLFLKPFVSSLIKINENGGVSWKNPVTNLTRVSPVRAPVIVADAPARAAVLDMQEHQAKYACNTCEQKTSKLPPPPVIPGEKKQRRKRRFLFKEEAAPLRTHQRILACADHAENDREPKKGIKGYTVIKNIPFMDLSTCVLSEYMHSVLCGVVKQICSMWLFVHGEWYIGHHLDKINEFLCTEIHPPDFVTRLPRSLEYFAYLKANEFRSFLLYFSLIVIAPYQKDEYQQHWMLLVQAIFLLLTESISETDLLTAEALLRLFVRDLGTLYGDEQYVYNVHQLLHLGLHVRRWGPLWSNSAFSYEDMNGTLSKMIHGTKREGKELVNQLFLAQAAQMLRNKIAIDNRKSSNISVLGKPLSRILTEQESICLAELNLELEGLQCYGRILVGKQLFSSVEYDKNFKRRNSYVEIKCDGQKKYGRVAFFIKSEDTVFCFVSICKVVHAKFFFHRSSLTRIAHIIPIQDSGEFYVCEVSNIIQKLIQVGDYLCFRPNSKETNL